MSTGTIKSTTVPAAGRPSVADLLARPGTRVVLLAGSRDPNAKVTLILLDDYGPAFAVKVPTTKVAQRAVRKEGQALAALAAMRLGPLAATLPHPVGYASSDGLSALVSTALPGIPMTVGYHGWRHTARPRQVRRDFRAAGAWLADLQTRTAGHRLPISLPSDVSTVIARRFRSHQNLAKINHRLAVASARLSDFTTPRTVVHGDYWFGNLLLDGDRVAGVIDWEAASLCGEPLRDVARFAVTYALYLDRHTAPGRRVTGHRGLRAGPWGAGVAHMLRGEGWFARITGDYLANALDRLGVPADLGREVLLVGIADVAATADHLAFARAHLDLLAGLIDDEPQAARSTVSALRQDVAGSLAEAEAGP